MKELVKYHVTPNNVTIYDSYKVTHTGDMEYLIQKIRYNYPLNNYIINKRSMSSLINEWKAHNLLYDLHLFRSHTRNVDLNNEPWYRKVIYQILSKFYIK